MKNESIQDYILKSESNLGVAAAVSEIWPAVRQKIVSGFLGSLESRLKKNLKGWEYGQYGQFFVDSDSGFFFLKPGWHNQYSIGLQFREYGEKTIVGVVRDNPDRGKREFCAELAVAFREIYPSATTHQWWEVRAPLRSPNPDWRNPEMLWKLKCQDKKFLGEVAEQLLAVAEISELFIDKLVAQHTKGK